jgi:hypothetical protein
VKIAKLHLKNKEHSLENFKSPPSFVKHTTQDRNIRKRFWETKGPIKCLMLDSIIMLFWNFDTRSIWLFHGIQCTHIYILTPFFHTHKSYPSFEEYIYSYYPFELCIYISSICRVMYRCPFLFSTSPSNQIQLWLHVVYAQVYVVNILLFISIH